MHVDPVGSADPIPFGIGGPPFARIRLQPMAGGLCRFSVSSNDPTDEGEEDIVQTERVPSRIVQTSASWPTHIQVPFLTSVYQSTSLVCFNSAPVETLVLPPRR